ncbi:MAG TPA: hypothetical protein PKH39_15725, partial [Woeseiaceae bacterium]|nr:hypothetical protein [Woeseiaceae bacterium]
ADGPTEALPDPIAKALIKGAQDYWQELVDAAEAEIAAARDSMDAELADLTAQLEAAKQEAAAANDTLGEKISAIDVLQKTAQEQAAVVAKQAKDLQARDVEIANLRTELKALRTQHDEIRDDLRTANVSLSESASEQARLSQRIERQATEFAKEKTALQKQFSEYKERLATTADDMRQANDAQRAPEKAALAAEHKATQSEVEVQRLADELTDATDESRRLAEKLGEARGQLGAADARIVDDKTSFERLLAEKDERAKALSGALAEAQKLVRQYVPKGKKLAQALIDERKSGG